MITAKSLAYCISNTESFSIVCRDLTDSAFELLSRALKNGVVYTGNSYTDKMGIILPYARYYVKEGVKCTLKEH